MPTSVVPAATSSPATSSAPIQMTRAQYQAKYGTPPPAPAAAAPVRMTQADYDAKYNPPAPTPADTNTPQNNPQIIKDAFQGGINQVKEGFQQSNNAQSPLGLLEGSLKMGAGAFNTAAAPVAPLFAPIGKMAQDIGNKVSDIPAVQKFATSKAGAGTIRATEDINNAATIAGGVASLKGGAKSQVPSIPKLPDVQGAIRSVPEAVKGAFKSSPETIVAKRTSELKKLEDSSGPVRRVVEKATKQGVDVKDLLARTDLLHGAVDTSGTIRTQNAIHELNDFIKPHEDVVSKVLEKEGRSMPLSKVEQALRTEVDNSKLEGAALENAHSKVTAEIAGLGRRADANGVIKLSKIHDAKVNKYATLDYLNEGAKIADKTIARTYKKLVESNTTSADVKALNKEMQSHYSVLNLLEKLDGKKVEGGRLGKYFAKTVGAIVGGHFGPLGAVIGAEVAGRTKGLAMATKLSGRTGAGLERSAALEKAVAEKDLPAALLPQETQSKSVGALNQSQSPTRTTANNQSIPGSVAPKAQPGKQSGLDFLKNNLGDQRGFVKFRPTAENPYGTVKAPPPTQAEFNAPLDKSIQRPFVKGPGKRPPVVIPPAFKKNPTGTIIIKPTKRILKGITGGGRFTK